MTPRAEATKPIPLGGRLFRAARSTTAERDDYLAGRIALSGVKNVTKEDGESPVDYVERLLGHLQASGYVDAMIGGLLTPLEIDDLEWTPAIAAETAAYAGQLHEPKDKEQRNVVLLTLLLDFFVAGMSSSAASSVSSEADENHPVTH